MSNLSAIIFCKKDYSCLATKKLVCVVVSTAIKWCNLSAWVSTFHAYFYIDGFNHFFSPLNHGCTYWGKYVCLFIHKIWLEINQVHQFQVTFISFHLHHKAFPIKLFTNLQPRATIRTHCRSPGCIKLN